MTQNATAPAGALPGDPAGAIMLTSPGQELEAAGLTIHGNIVGVTQGRTLDDEILGSGDAAQAHQVFRLASGPLTYTSTGADTRPSLTVRVDGVPWTQLDNLADAGPDDRVFMLLRDLNGRVSVQFGCGIYGARLPTGRDNVTARYRIGIGAAAPQQNTITTLLRSAARIAGVTNLEAGQPGADAETLTDARRHAPNQLRTRDRLVTRGDHQDYAAGFPGIWLAQVETVTTPSGALLVISVAAGDATPVPLETLRAAMLARSIQPTMLRVLAATLRHVSVTLTARPQAGAQPEFVQADAAARLTRRCGFGIAISVASIAAGLRGMANVTELAIDTLDGQPATDAAEVVPGGSGWDADTWTLRPAEVLTIEPADVVLQLEPADG
jgi:predicted phage baseplate assembly protein